MVHLVSMDSTEKNENFENEEKINPFGAMNQINLDVDFSLSLLRSHARSLKWLLRFHGNIATFMLFSMAES